MADQKTKAKKESARNKTARAARAVQAAKAEVARAARASLVARPLGAAQAEAARVKAAQANVQNVRADMEASKDRGVEAVADAKAAAWAVAVAARADVDAAMAELKAIRENAMCCMCLSARRTFSCRVGTNVYARIASRIF